MTVFFKKKKRIEHPYSTVGAFMPVVLDMPIFEIQKSLYGYDCFKHIVARCMCGLRVTKDTIRISGFSMDQAFGYTVFV